MTQRLPLNRDRVVRAALDLVDEEGLAALTMRRLGQRLGVEAMSLYNHVPGKEGLLDDLVDLVVAEIELPAGDGGWTEAMRRRAVSARAVFARHPWAPALIDSRTTSGPVRLRYFDWVIGTLRRAGFSVELAMRAFSLLDSYVYGSAKQQLGAGAAGEGDRAGAEAMLATVRADEFPYLVEVIQEYALGIGHDDRADFAFGLDLILDGLERARGRSMPGGSRSRTNDPFSAE